MSGFWEAACELDRASTPFVVITLVSERGHVPQDAGAKAIVTSRGLHWGTVGGGRVEARAIEEARSVLQNRNGSPSRREPRLVKWNLQTDIGMSCGGEASFLFELHERARWRVAVFGAGHVAQALSRVLVPLDCQISVFDARAEWIERLPAAPNLARFCVGNSVDHISDLDGDSYFVVMTQGHATDLPILRALFETHPNAPYIGVMGSPVKAKKIRSELGELGVSNEQLARLRSPIGLSLGGNQPHEIAISIAAEILQVRDQHNPLGSTVSVDASCANG